MSVSISPPIEAVVAEAVDSIRHQLAARSYRAANEMRDAAIDVLAGARGGRRYRVPHTNAYYTASAPGEPPAPRTGAFRNSWQPSVEQHGDRFISKIESDLEVNGYVLGELLENGTSRMAPRPHHDRIKEQALPGVMRIYSEPYF